jgi:excisionase family DNA binding protein
MADEVGPMHMTDRTGRHDSGANERVSRVPQPGKLLLTPEEAAATLSVDRTRVYELIAQGQLTSVRIGVSRRIPRVALERFVVRLLKEADVDGEAT